MPIVARWRSERRHSVRHCHLFAGRTLRIAMKYRLGIDIGGTFADFFLFGGGKQLWAKTLVSQGDPAKAVLSGLADLAEQLGVSIAALCGDIELIVHGTTVTTNAVLTRNGAPTMLLTTGGFRDALQMRRGVKERQYDNRYAAPEPLVPRFLRIGVAERTTKDGRITQALLEDDVAAALELAKREDIKAIAVCFMHAYADDTNERAAAKFISNKFDGYVTLSSHLLQRAGFYDRLSTTVFDAYVGPILKTYLNILVDLLDRVGFSGTFLIMMSNGGLAAPKEVQTAGVTTIMSGPSAGPIAGARFAGVHGFQDAVTVDMGGTSFDAALVQSGAPLVVRDMEFDGYVIGLPTVDIHSIGAGGGSIAWMDQGGLLHVGPQSVGSNPGPACYGLGGTEATCTDADLALGYLNPDYFLGGRMKIDVDRAMSALNPLAAKLDASEIEIAAGINRIINAHMAAGVRAITVNRGTDPRLVPLIVAGGAGPVHAAPIALELNIPVVIIPQLASVFCAVGLLLSEMKYDFVRSFFGPLDNVDAASWSRVLNDMIQRGTAALRANKVPPERIRARSMARLRYVGQYREIDVDVQPAELESGRAKIATRFHALHEKLYGHSVPQQPIETVDLAVTCFGENERIELAAPSQGGTASELITVGSRPVYLPDAGAMKTIPVYRGGRLSASNKIPGPTIIELLNTSVFVPTEFDLRTDAIGSFVLCQKSAPQSLRTRLGFQ
jgi:N-methylhydantoinase A